MADIPLATESIHIQYCLPLTQIKVRAAINNTLRIAPPASEGAEPQTVVVKEPEATISTAVVADARTNYQLILDSEVLEEKNVTLELDKNRIITGLNTSLSRDVSPIIDALSNLAPLAVAVAPAFGLLDVSLEAEWSIEFPTLHARLLKLESTLQKLLVELEKSDDAPNIMDDLDRITNLGSALDVVKAEIAAIHSIRRDWIAAHATIEPEETFEFNIIDTYSLSTQQMGPNIRPPKSLKSSIVVPNAQKELAETYGCLIAVWDSETQKLRTDPDNAPPPPQDTTNFLILRLPRVAIFAVYTRAVGTDENSPLDWELNANSVQRITLVDDLSGLRSLDLTAEWFEKRTLELSMNDDQSISKFGASTSSTLGGVMKSSSSLLASAKDFIKKPDKTSADDKALAQAKAKIELLKASSELSRLANRHGLADEIELADRLVRIADK